MPAARWSHLAAECSVAHKASVEKVRGITSSLVLRTLSHLVQMTYIHGVKLPADRLLEWSKSFTDKVWCVGVNRVLSHVHASEAFCLTCPLKTWTTH